MELNLRRPLVVFDLESTGLNITEDRIIELSYVKVYPDGKEESKTYRFNPEKVIPQQAIDMHGITNEDLKDEPTFKERAHDIADAVAKKRADFAGHFRGRVVKIVVEDSGTLAGWTSEDLWCRLSRAFAEARVNSLSGRTTFPRKSIVAMRVTEVKGDSLRGVPV